MNVIIGSDHRGFALAQALSSRLEQQGISVTSVGAKQYDKDDDYVDFAERAARMVASSQAQTRGIVICGSGVGVSVAANKIPGIRCGLGFSEEQVKSARADDDINVLALPADYVTEDDAYKLVKLFLETEFSHAERHTRRIKKVESLEKHGA